MSENEYWGYHLILDAADCDRDCVTNPAKIADFAKALVKKIDMVAYGEPQIVHFGEDNKAGYTLVQLIETSNICAHFCDESGDVYLDVFSCKPFDPDVAIQLFADYFLPEKTQHSFLTRKA